MRAKLALKNIYRSWIRSAFIFILLAAVTYSLFSNVMEYAITRRETNHAIELYDGVGTVEDPFKWLSGDAANQNIGTYIYTDKSVDASYFTLGAQATYRAMDYDPLSSEALEQIEQLPYVTYTDRRYMTAGLMDDYYRLTMDDEYYYNFTNNYVIEATVEDYYMSSQGVLLTDYKILAGKELFNFDLPKIWMICQPEAPVTILADGTESRPSIWSNGPAVVTEEGKYNAQFGENLVPGERYVFIAKLDRVARDGEYTRFYLTDHLTYPWCEGVQSLKGAPENYLETEEFAPLKSYIETVNSDLHTFDVVYTQNMGSIRFFSDGTLGIAEGRRLTRDDYLENSNVCVISHDMAREFGLEIGDTITVDLGNKLYEQYAGLGAIAGVPQRLSSEYTEETLEIVGVWKDTRRAKLANNTPTWSYSNSTIFVPTHLLNVPDSELEKHEFRPGEFSFVIEDVYSVEAFRKECVPVIRELGLKLTLVDGNWQEIEQAFNDTKRMSIIKIIVLSAAVFAATWFTVLLYVLGRKRDYAIMRVLGAAKKKSRNTILLPLMVITAAAVISGTAASWIYTVNNIKLDDIVSSVQTIVLDTSVPVWLVAMCVLAELLLALGIAAMILGFIGRKSPLALLQDSSQKRAKKKKQKEQIQEEETVPVVSGVWEPLGKAVHDGKSRRGQFIRRYVLRDIRRTAVKSLMFILVTVLLLNVAGQLGIMHQLYCDTLEETEIISNYAGCLNIFYVSQLQESGYVKDVFYRAQTAVDINKQGMNIYITNDIERLLKKEVDITYLEGYDESIMQTHENILILDEKVMDVLKVGLGDTVRLGVYGSYARKIYERTMHYKVGTLGASKLSDDEVFELIKDEIEEWYLEHSDEFIVVGCVNGTRTPYAYLPGSADENIHYGKMAILDMVEATLIDNWKTKEYRAYGEELAGANKTGEVAFIMDSSKAEHIANNIQLLELLYPVAVAATLVIGAFLTCLIIVQTSKDIAIMRVLGTSKRRTRVIIVLERMILCVIGMIIAALIMMVMRGVNGVVLEKMVIVLGLYFVTILAFAIIAAVFSSRKNVLELLQTKE